MIPNALTDITKEDILALIQSRRVEDRTIEYKIKFPDDSEQGKAKFLATVSAFANTAGGDLIYGVEAVDGLPVKVHGLRDNIDAAKLRFESLLQSRIAPRVRLDMQSVIGFLEGPVLIVRVYKSWNAPHMVKFGESIRFYARHNAGNYALDAGQIRSAYAISEELPERIRRWRDERLAKIIQGETPVPLPPDPKLVVHLVPLNSFDPRVNFSIADLESYVSRLRPIGASRGWNDRINVDGWVTFLPGDDVTMTYCQMFRTGRIESINAFVSVAGVKIYLSEYEPWVIAAVESYFEILKALNVPYPVLIMTSMLNVLGCHMYQETAARFQLLTHPIDRDTLLLPEILLEEHPSDVGAMLRPIFDAIWNACGYKGCPNYNKDGKWEEDRR